MNCSEADAPDQGSEPDAPDGICPMFFQSYSHIVEPSVTNMVLKILRGDSIPSHLNYSIPSHLNCTFITLIPKKGNSEYMTDFRPIS